LVQSNLFKAADPALDRGGPVKVEVDFATQGSLPVSGTIHAVSIPAGIDCTRTLRGREGFEDSGRCSGHFNGSITELTVTSSSGIGPDESGWLCRTPEGVIFAQAARSTTIQNIPLYGGAQEVTCRWSFQAL
jgi:hypothetical protein